MASTTIAPEPLELQDGDAVRKFLLGSWALSKTIDYRKGGAKGKMVGTAKFEQASELSTALLYEERGELQLEGMSAPLQAYRRYCFNTAVWPVEVYFIDDPTKKHLTTLLPQLECHTSFFVPLTFASLSQPSTAASFEHLCIEDLYTGELKLQSADAFEWNWVIRGPEKDGNIACSYTRQIADSTAKLPTQAQRDSESESQVKG